VIKKTLNTDCKLFIEYKENQTQTSLEFITNFHGTHTYIFNIHQGKRRHPDIH